ncbi:hypothetical protein FRC17_007583, partial [Serendipita sp. 399]
MAASEKRSGEHPFGRGDVDNAVANRDSLLAHRQKNADDGKMEDKGLVRAAKEQADQDRPHAQARADAEYAAHHALPPPQLRRQQSAPSGVPPFRFPELQRGYKPPSGSRLPTSSRSADKLAGPRRQ